MVKTQKLKGGMEPNNSLTIEQTTQETGAQAMARKLLQPTLKNAAAASAFTSKMMGSDLELPGLGDYADHVQAVTHEAAGGGLAMVSKILAAQAVTLDSMFAELARRAAMNMGEYINAAERYGRLALKAQSNCRTTLEALAKLHQPREQTVRHVHVTEGGQALIADQFHHHAGGAENAKSNDQSHAAGAAGESAALSGPNSEREGLPIPGRKRKAALQDARRH
jgi:hypothetical protein